MSTTSELVPSVSIENLVNQRAAVVQRISQAVDLIREASAIAGAAHLGMPRLTISTGYGRGSDERTIADARIGAQRNGATWDREASDRAEVDKMIRLGVDAAAWQYLMHESGLRTFMDATARQKWDRAIADGDIPELTDATVRATFKMLHDSRGEIFERGVIACFKSLSWQYKTNLPQKFGKRLVMTYLRNAMGGSKWGLNSLGHVNSGACDKLDDLVRVMTILDGKPEPDHRLGWYSRLNAVKRTTDPDAADDYIVVKSYRNGNGHLTFKRLDLVDQMNLIIAKHYPGALPAPK